jgi:hypothetical protein
MVMPGGRRRDSVYFSVLDDEWPRVRQHLESRLARNMRAAAVAQGSATQESPAQ